MRITGSLIPPAFCTNLLYTSCTPADTSHSLVDIPVDMVDTCWKELEQTFAFFEKTSRLVA